MFKWKGEVEILKLYLWLQQKVKPTIVLVNSYHFLFYYSVFFLLYFTRVFYSFYKYNNEGTITQILKEVFCIVPHKVIWQSYVWCQDLSVTKRRLINTLSNLTKFIDWFFTIKIVFFFYFIRKLIYITYINTFIIIIYL